MNYSLTCPIFFSLLLSFSLSYAQPEFRFLSCDNGLGNFTNASTFASNLNALLSAIASDTKLNSGEKLFNLTAGGNTGVDQVNGIAFCRGDVSPSICKSCVSDATQRIRLDCPNQKQAIGWYNECMLRYSNRSIFATLDTSPVFYRQNNANASDVNTFNRQLGNVLRQLLSTAEAGNSRLKFAEDGPVPVTDFVSIYALAECTPDLTSVDCSNCINNIINFIPKYNDGRVGVTGVSPSCNVRYEIYPFFYAVNDTLSPPSHSPSTHTSPPPPPPQNATAAAMAGKKRSMGAKLAIAIIVPIVACTVLVVIFSYCCFFKRKTQHKVDSLPSIHKIEDDTRTIESFRFDFITIKEATNNFSDANKLGRGGFGTVYKGTLSNGQQLAVKRLASNSTQGELEFKNEVLLVAKLQHRNLVRLLGFCFDGDERILIYEFLSNSSLDNILFDPVKRTQLDWQMRYKVITGIARGLLYLHEDSQLRIIHRDLKASNILLDAEMDAKISDFGIAKLFHAEQTHGDTNRVVGTYGYMAPEYVLHGFFSAKSDVYSFGILIMEMISGRRCIGLNQEDHTEDLISFVWRNWREGTVMSIVDKSMSMNSNTEIIIRCIQIGLLCVQEDATDRPTMSAIVVMMSSHSFTLSIPSHPAFVTQSFNKLHPRGSLGTPKNSDNKSKSLPALQISENVDSSSEFIPR